MLSSIANTKRLLQKGQTAEQVLTLIFNCPLQLGHLFAVKLMRFLLFVFLLSGTDTGADCFAPQKLQNKESSAICLPQREQNIFIPPDIFDNWKQIIMLKKES
jgi:hypothetical protein